MCPPAVSALAAQGWSLLIPILVLILVARGAIAADSTANSTDGTALVRASIPINVSHAATNGLAWTCTGACQLRTANNHSAVQLLANDTCLWSKLPTGQVTPLSHERFEFWLQVSSNDEAHNAGTLLALSNKLGQARYSLSAGQLHFQLQYGLYDWNASAPCSLEPWTWYHFRLERKAHVWNASIGTVAALTLDLPGRSPDYSHLSLGCAWQVAQPTSRFRGALSLPSIDLAATHPVPPPPTSPPTLSPTLADQSIVLTVAPHPDLLKPPYNEPTATVAAAHRLANTQAGLIAWWWPPTHRDEAAAAHLVRDWSGQQRHALLVGGPSSGARSAVDPRLPHLLPALSESGWVLHAILAAPAYEATTTVTLSLRLWFPTSPAAEWLGNRVASNGSAFSAPAALPLLASIGSTDARFELRRRAATLQLWMGTTLLNTTDAQSGIAFPPTLRTWLHLAFVLEPGTAHLYANGSFLGSWALAETWSFPASENWSVFVGAEVKLPGARVPQSVLEAHVHDVRLYASALDQSRIQAIAADAPQDPTRSVRSCNWTGSTIVTAPSTAAFHILAPRHEWGEHMCGNLFLDNGANGAHAVQQNAAWATNTGNGPTLSAMRINAAARALKFPFPPRLPASLSVSFWCRPDNATRLQSLFLYDMGGDGASPSGGALEIRLAQERFQLYVANGDVNAATPITTGLASQARSGQWSHVALTFSAGWARIYVNGTLAQQASIGSTQPPLTAAFVIGGRTTTSIQAYAGLLDKVRLYDFVLNAQQVASLATNQEILILTTSTTTTTTTTTSTTTTELMSTEAPDAQASAGSCFDPNAETSTCPGGSQGNASLQQIVVTLIVVLVICVILLAGFAATLVGHRRALHSVPQEGRRWIHLAVGLLVVLLGMDLAAMLYTTTLQRAIHSDGQARTYAFVNASSHAEFELSDAGHIFWLYPVADMGQLQRIDTGCSGSLVEGACLSALNVTWCSELAADPALSVGCQLPVIRSGYDDSSDLCDATHGLYPPYTSAACGRPCCRALPHSHDRSSTCVGCRGNSCASCFDKRAWELRNEESWKDTVEALTSDDELPPDPSDLQPDPGSPKLVWNRVHYDNTHGSGVDEAPGPIAEYDYVMPMRSKRAVTPFATLDRIPQSRASGHSVWMEVEDGQLSPRITSVDPEAPRRASEASTRSRNLLLSPRGSNRIYPSAFDPEPSSSTA
ncbi:uncharacterized protein MONBRDRAFT_7940 [Monosiga brevicollis MX1]|uniref:LamG-like jellyroll fold domain-containing protein n=1 Tax=Monosiga brevicollis TaxID=81824 RepID=A9UYJ6_MONBE|nr:uncharacterized protein MONBRDRAFT_7940 [Monosiga brevicollis MX1]EDQ89473.1 predicted protein [Monosiga brevicollis MX1]|eukprot:XP_001745502.1 hypothetical protein [Monosiga brevicollis MX1]